MTTTQTPMTRGYMVLSCIDYVEHAYDPAAREKIYAGLSPEVREMRGKYNGVEWYVRKHCEEYFTRIAMSGANEADSYTRLVDCGKFIAKQATNTYMKLLLKIITPTIFGKKLGDFWSRDHRGGVMEADPEASGDQKIVVHLRGIEGYTHVAPTACGFISYALETMGKRNVKATVSGWSMATPAPRDVRYEITWS